MRFVVYGAGAVGGVVGGRLAQHGHDVVLIARGAHAEAMRRNGLRIDSAAGSVTLTPPVHEHPSEITWRGDEVVVLGVKGQDTDAALTALSGCVPAAAPIVCLQNGVANERRALRRFANVYGVCVMCPAGHLEPGVVVAYAHPVAALLDIGRYPRGSDGLCGRIAEAINVSGMESVVRDDIMRWKHTKLLMNLGNAIGAVIGPQARGGRLYDMARAEGVECRRAAGIDFASMDEDRARRADKLRFGPVTGQKRFGDSSWQSLARGTGAIETDYLNGEIVLLGRVYGVPTPVNALLQDLANEAARDRRAPGALTEEEVLGRLDAATGIRPTEPTP
ncbi:MAG TPA: 2-dehydropantoate 2-reductase N-terminal domain-containing protein [Acidimicrobiales bacterium]|nr:2-dehydropantoate 2-reductase N-terminal domain-containing protein [Acidimicrobiales bacterium]